MITKDNVVSVSKLRQNVGQAIKKAVAEKEPIYIFRGSEPQAVLLDIESYNAFAIAVEDFLDAQELLNVGAEELKDAAPWKEFKKKRGLP